MKIIHQQHISSRIKLFAWLNIGVQCAFPLSLAFTPAIAGGPDSPLPEIVHKQNKQKKATSQKSPETQIYTLSAGETTASVAKKYHTTPEALRQLNRLRTFAHGFNHLQPGDELDVPVAIGDKKKPTTSALQDDAETRKAANMASRAGAFLANNPNGETALSLARGQVSAEASGQVQQWLNQFGTARVQLDTGEHFSLKNSQLDLLIPFYEQKDRLFFTQGSLHRTDDRTQANLGFGTRYFTPSYMLGSNIFGDYDLSRTHSRLGAGVEYWRDFLKLSANGYLRLSDWRDSPDLTDYQERPANGWDVRAQAWFPGLPQLGGKLTFEQYYGKDVALFGKENRQNNPHAIAAGVNFTPIPLLTLGAEHRQGQSGKNDSRLSLDLTYRPGVSWQQQMNPQEVASMRSLSGSRYDLVERNNHMVLQYRKQELIQLHTATRVVGQAGEQKSLSVSVDSKYGLDRIDWSASSLLAAGGILQRDDAGGWSVILPPYQSGEQAANTWTISGVAVDKKGNVSARSHTQVVLAQQDVIDASMSPVAPQKITFQADGQMQQQLVLKINDRDGKPIDVAESEIGVLRESKLRTTSLTEITPFTRRAAGEFTATVTAGTQPESFTLIPSARNVRFAPVSIEVTAIDDVILVQDPIIATPTSAIVGEKVTYTALLTDKQGNPKGAGIPVNWAANQGSALSAQTTSTDETGTVAVDLTRTEPGLAKVSLTLPSGEKTAAPDVPFSADAPDENRSELTLEPSVIASGKGSATLTLILRDKNGNTLPGNKVHGQSDNSSVKISHAEEIADKPGHYRMEVTASKPGKAMLSVNVNGKPFSQPQTLLTITDESITPDLNFATSQQNVTWTKDFSASQAVSGMPEGVEQQWSSSDNSVATVNEVGKVTLLKSGQTTITVKTSGNDQYHPAEASYQLEIDKADPQLQAGDGGPITAKWADGKVWSIASKFGNADADNILKATYTSKNIEVVTVADSGELQAVKPGSTRLTVSTPETDQFKANSVEVAYQLDKGTVVLSFKEAAIKTTDEETFTLQLPENTVPSDAVITWNSADKNVLNISSAGNLLGKVSKGKTRLTLSVAASDYYSASSNYYDVSIYSKPLVSMGTVTYISKGVMADKGVWTPVFTDDKLSVTWSTDSSDEFSKAKFVVVALKDSSGKSLAQKTVNSPTGSITTTFEPKPHFWNEKLHVELMSQGYGTLTDTEKSAGISVKNMEPIEIWKSFKVTSVLTAHSNRGRESSCRAIAGPAGTQHWVYADINRVEINFGGRTLVSPMGLTGALRLTGKKTPGWVQPTKLPNRLTAYSDASSKFGELKIVQDCWTGDEGSYDIEAHVNYYGKNFIYLIEQPHYWKGNGSGIDKTIVDNMQRPHIISR
ncbi:inverse autotransporter beta domain-containing protein [Erwinia piriflorinigrans]|uniref:Intimin n=1 Tax=Erwinia piriflorinigrans CFBP 5888 TaxID=1161919 RepID=V5ZBH9_9GAMM|nr:inverse autotransporter beta-barrel domain-containing protein [Erwinia piriflorinigrans]CCG88753.1 putative AT-3 family protein [Erwinia piriflorinigrans CFBP 5888]